MNFDKIAELFRLRGGVLTDLVNRQDRLKTAQKQVDSLSKEISELEARVRGFEDRIKAEGSK